MKKFLSSLIMLCSLLLCNCIEYTEEIWFHSDWSGIIKIQLCISEMASKVSGLEKDITKAYTLHEDEFKKQVAQSPGLRVLEAGKYQKEESECLSLSVEFQDLPSLKGLFEKEGEADLYGDIQIKKDENGDIIYLRTINFGLEEENQLASEDQLAAGMMKKLFHTYQWKYTVHFPYRIREANTEEGKAKGKSASWNFSLGSLAAGKQTMKAVLQTHNYLFTGGIAFLILVSLLLLENTYRKVKDIFRKKPASEQRKKEL